MLKAYVIQLVPQEKTDIFFINIYRLSITVNDWYERRWNPHNTAQKVNMRWTVIALLLLSSGAYTFKCMSYCNSPNTSPWGLWNHHQYGIHSRGRIRPSLPKNHIYFRGKHEHQLCSKCIFNNMIYVYSIFLDFQLKWKHRI